MSLVDAPPFRNAKGDLCGLCDGTDEHEHPCLACAACGVRGLSENMGRHQCAVVAVGPGAEGPVAKAHRLAREKLATLPDKEGLIYDGGGEVFVLERRLLGSVRAATDQEAVIYWRQMCADQRERLHAYRADRVETIAVLDGLQGPDGIYWSRAEALHARLKAAATR